MQMNSWKTILGVTAISALLMACGKPNETRNYKMLDKKAGSSAPTEVKPEEVLNPDMQLVAKTLKGAQLVKAEDGALDIMGLVYINDLNVFEITAQLKDMKEGPENSQEILADAIAVESVMDLGTLVEANPANKITATCFEACKLVRVVMNLNTQDGKYFDVAMHFKQVEVEGSYFLDQSDAGQKRGYSALDYSKTLIELQSQVNQALISASIDGDVMEPGEGTTVGKDGGNFTDDIGTNTDSQTEPQVDDVTGTGSAELDALGQMIGDGITNASNTILNAYTGGQVGANQETTDSETVDTVADAETQAEPQTPAEISSFGQWISNGIDAIVGNWNAVREHAAAQAENSDTSINTRGELKKKKTGTYGQFQKESDKSAVDQISSTQLRAL